MNNLPQTGPKSGCNMLSLVYYGIIERLMRAHNVLYLCSDRFFSGGRMFQSHLDTFLRSEPHTTRSYACVSETKAQMWNLHPHDTRSTRFEKKMAGNFFPS